MHVISGLPIIQVKHEQKLKRPFHFYKQQGVYPSHIRLNFEGGPAEKALRHDFAVFDNNAFVTLWVTSILLETTRFTEGPRPTVKQLLMDAVEALSTYHDRNRPANSSIMTFWPETYNSSTDTWTQGPVNLGAMASDFAKLEAKYFMKFEHYLEDILKKVHLEGSFEKFASFINQL